MYQDLQGTNAIRDALTAAVEPVFGLATASGCLVTFLDEAPPSPELEAVRANSWAYALVGIAKIMMRLPPDILEEEIPRIKGTLTTVCYRSVTPYVNLLIAFNPGYLLRTIGPRAGCRHGRHRRMPDGPS